MRRWMLWYAVVLHLVWGVVILLSVQPTYTTPIGPLYDLIPNRAALGLTLIAVSLLATAGILESRDWIRGSVWGIALVSPQQIVLILSAWGGLEASINQMYGDGVPRPFLFIFPDQFATMLAAFTHSAALLWPGRNG